jgi:hypothetical protein
MWDLTKNIGKEKANAYRAPEYKQFLRLRLLSFSAIGLIMIGILLGVFFIYQNIFVTVSEAQQIIMVKSNLSALEIIDFTKFDKVKKSWQQKNNTLATLPINDPLNVTSTSTPVATSFTTSTH